jgi:hypothetical protein
VGARPPSALGSSHEAENSGNDPKKLRAGNFFTPIHACVEFVSSLSLLLHFFNILFSSTAFLIGKADNVFGGVYGLLRMKRFGYFIYVTIGCINKFVVV